jgi:rhodanese-related sulfurtransferase
MFDSLKKILGIKSTDFAQLVKDGALILDVRTAGEFGNGHINGSVNVPLNKMPHYLPKLKDKKKTIIVCCASGSRSAQAMGVLQYNGFTNIYDGGSWYRLNSKINQQ